MVINSLKDLKEGDDVVYVEWFAPNKLIKITKRTPTQICCGNMRFNLKGTLVGARYFDMAFIRVPEENDYNINKE